MDAPRIEGAAVRVVAPAGSAREFSFRVTGLGPMTLTWLHQGQPLKASWWDQFPNGERLRLPALWEEQEGIYELVAENAAGSARSEPIELIVEDGVPVRFSPESGVYTHSVTVDLDAVFAPDAARDHLIMYTDDGTEPHSRHGTQYTTPIVVTGTSTIKARAVFWDTPLGRTHTASYRINAPEPSPPGPEARLVARYRFEDAGARVAIDEAGWESGQLSAVGAGLGAGGIEGGALSLRASEGGQVMLPGAPMPWGSSWSVAVWFRTQPGETRPMALVTWGGMSPSYGTYLALNVHGGTLAAHCGAGHYLTTDAVVNDGAWHHAVLSRSVDGDTRIHVDGGSPRHRVVNGPAAQTGVVAVAGACGVGLESFHFEGAIDDLQFYSFQLSSDHATFLATNPGATLAVPLRDPPPLPQLIPINEATSSGWAPILAGDRLFLPFRESPPATSRYQWFRNGTPVAGATEARFELASASPADSGVYRLVASNRSGQTSTESVAVNVGTGAGMPQWSGLPSRVTADRGGSVEFAPIHGEPIGARYQWYHHGIALPEATELTLRLDRISPRDAGEYYSRIETASGTFWSKPSRLTVLGDRAPVFSDGPTQLTPWVGETLEITTSFEGTLPISYQWMKDGTPISGATARTLTLESVGPEVAGVYRLQASNAFGKKLGPDIAVAPTPPPAVRFVLQASMAPTFVSALLDPSAPYLTIRHTLDGSEPSADSPMFLGTLYFATEARISAAVFLGSLRLGSTYTVDVPRNPDYPRITTPLSDLTVDEGSFFTLTVTAEGPEPLTYVWYKDDVVLPRAALATSVVGPARLADAGMYHVSVHNRFGSIASERFRVTVRSTATEAPVIIGQPKDTTVSEGTRVRLSVQATGSQPLTYLWTFNGGARVLSTSSDLVLTNSRPDQSGLYQVRVSNSKGAAESIPARVTIAPRIRAAPVILSHPASQIVPYGRNVTFEVRAISAEHAEYRWRFNGAALPSETSSVLRLNSATEERAGSYDVIVSNRDGSVTSAPAILTVLPPSPPRIVQWPGDVVADEGLPLNLTDSSEGTPPLSFRWFQNGELLPEFGGETLGVYALSLDRAGQYVVEVSNRQGSVRSTPFSLGVRERPPVITQQPAEAFVDESEDLKLEVRAVGTLPLTFQWRRDGVPIPGATESVWRRANAHPNDSGRYDVTISNRAGEVVSEPIQVTVASLAGGTLQFVNRITGVLDAPVFAEDGTTRLEGDAYRAQLFAGPTPDSLAPIGPAVPFRTGAAAGYWDPQGQSLRRITAVQPGAWAAVQVRAWARADGASFDEAVARLGPVGVSPVLFVVTGGAGTPPSPPSLLPDLASFRLARVPPPEIVSTPAAQHLGIGSPLTLAVGVRGSDLTFQWFRDGELLPGAQGAALHIAAASASDSGIYQVEVRNAAGVRRSTDIPVAIAVRQTLSARSIDPAREGSTLRIPLELDSQGDVVVATAVLRFDPEVLAYLQTEWPQDVTPVHASDPFEAGQLRITIGDPAGLRSDTRLLAHLEFRVLDIAESRSTSLEIVDVQYTDSAERPILWGSAVRNTRLELLAVAEIGDNNANGILDLGDPAIAATLMEQPGVIPKWIIAGSDANGDGRISREDVVALLRRVLIQEIERASLTPSELNQGSGVMQAVPTSLPRPLLEMTVDPKPISPGDRLRVRVTLPAGSPRLRASSFTLRYPAQAFALTDGPRLATPGLLTGQVSHAVFPEDPSAEWDIARVRFAVTTGTPWPDHGGALVDFEFRAQPGIGLLPEWRFVLEDVQWTLDGYSIHRSADSRASVTVRVREAPKFHTLEFTPTGHVRLIGSGDPWGRFVLESSDGFGLWVQMAGVDLDESGSFDVVLTDQPVRGSRFFRLRDATSAGGQ